MKIVKESLGAVMSQTIKEYHTVDRSSLHYPRSFLQLQV